MKTFVKNIVFPIIVTVLLGTVLLMSMQFAKQSEKIDLTDNTQKEEPSTEQKLINESTMSSEEIIDLLTKKRTDFQTFLNEMQYFELEELGISEENMIGIDDTFLTKFRSYLTEDTYLKYLDNITFIKEENNKQYYKVNRSIFENLYYESAIASLNTNNIEIIPVKATNDEITSIVKIQMCEDDEHFLCPRDDAYRFIVKNIDGEWKIAEFQAKAKNS